MALATAPRTSSRRAPRLTTVTGRDLAAHRLTMGIARTTLAAALHVHHYRLAALERSTESLDATRYRRWHDALQLMAQRRLDDLARQGWSLDELPTAMREAFALYLPCPNGATSHVN